MADAPILAHQQWLGLIQPVGLVVVPSALVAANIVIEETERTQWQLYATMCAAATIDDGPALTDFLAFAESILEWDLRTVAGTPSGPVLPEMLTVALPELRAQLEPSYAVPDPDKPDEWQLLVKVLPHDTTLDNASDNGAWTASPHDQFERLLRETNAPIGIIATDTTVRLVSRSNRSN